MHCPLYRNHTPQLNDDGNMETAPKWSNLLSSTADEFPSLPPLSEELILLILFKLPVKSLARFKCVSKSWKTLISDRQFAKEHLQAIAADPNMTYQRLVSSVIRYDDSEIVSLSMQSLFQTPSSTLERYEMSEQWRVLGSCNGLLCLGDVHQRFVMLWNPTIRSKSNPLPISVGSCEWFTHYGFGYDDVNDKYKLLVAVANRDETVTKVYTFGADDNWTLILNFPIPNIYPSNWSGKYVSNTLNWIARRGVGYEKWVIVILSFDLTTETYGEVLLPFEDGVQIRDPVLDVLRDCLCVSSFDSKKACLDVWLMKKYGVQESWTKLVMIPDFNGIWGGLSMFRPLCISEDGVVLLENRFSTLVLYNSNDGSVSYPRTRSNVGFRLQIHYDSLVSVPCYNQCL